MTAYNLLDAIGMINDEDILDAKEAVRTVVNHMTVRHGFVVRKRGRRTTICIAAVIAIIFGSFVTAMAVNEDFRYAVYSFFHISTPDVGLPEEDEPKQSNDLEVIYETDIENIVNVEYIRINGNFDYGRGLIYLHGEAGDGSAFYTIKNGQLEKLKTNETSLAYTWKGTEYDIKFSWCEEDGAIYIYSTGKEPANDAFWYVSPVNGRTDVVTLTISFGRQNDYSEYTFFLNLNTQEVTDIFDGCGVDQLSGITSTVFSKDMSKAIITCGNGTSVYYCDMNTKTLLMVSEFTGMPVNAAWFLDDNTIFSYTVDENSKCTCWHIFPSTNECTLLFTDLPIYSRTSGNGIIFTGTRYGLYVDLDKTTYMYDFKTGSRAIVEGLAYSGEDATVIMNANGTKMLYAKFDYTADSLAISQLGVIDIEKGMFTILERKGYEIRDEAAVSWFDNDRISILATNSSGEKYLYLYSFTS
ncbi:MAG TPA: hypothetical protein VFD00_07150 [Thermoclostridium sp.]|nr:hypothetical protein [Thermoclostridium sp.]